MNVIELKENDIYSFRYNEKEMKERFDPWHCFDGQLVVRGGKLIDTYWGIGSTDGAKAFTLSEALANGSLEFKCNLDEVDFCSEDDKKYYDEGDIINLSTQQGYYKRFARKKGSVRSKEKIFETLSYKIEEYKWDIKSKEYWVGIMEEDLKKVLQGDTNVYF